MTEPSAAAQIIQDWISQPDYAASDWTTLESRITAALARATAAERERWYEITAGAHAVRCTCGDHMRWTDGRWDIRDPRCIDVQEAAAALRAGAPAERRP